MRLSESGAAWQSVPSWVDFLIQYGFTWAAQRNKRRIGAVSMPCESAGAGLVALGALRHRLSLEDAADSLSHFERIQKFADRGDAETFLCHNVMAGRYRLEGRDRSGLVWVRLEPSRVAEKSEQSGPPRIAILPRNAGEWRFEREAPTQVLQGSGLPYGGHYRELLDGAAAALESNLLRSDSAICIASRVAGESVSRSAFSAVRFESGGEVADLAQLLAVHSWSPDSVSRVTIFNSRTGRTDRSADSTELVVADGDLAFLRALEAAEFQRSDVVGVLHRAVERDRLDSVGTKLAELAQWYVPDDETNSRLPEAPPGITLSVLKRR